MPIYYTYRVEGTAAHGQTWMNTGTVRVATPGNFPDVPGLVLRHSFEALTEGRAEYGQPGKGCHGPYTIVSLTITRRDKEN